MNKLALCSVTFRDKTVEEIIKIAKEAGLDGIEWGADVHVPPSDKENARRVGELTRAAGLEVLSYGSYYFAGEGMDFTPISEAAKELGTGDIRVWAGKMNRDKGIGEVDQKELANIVQDIQALAVIAEANQQQIHLEFHQWTYTDTAESTINVLKSVDRANVDTYWQPNVHSTHQERMEQLQLLKDKISNIHVFYWGDNFKRYPLEHGAQNWQDYLSLLTQYGERYYALEFVKDDSIEQFKEDVATLKQLLKA